MAHPQRLRNRRIGVETSAMRVGRGTGRDRRALAVLVAVFALLVQAFIPAAAMAAAPDASGTMVICTGTGVTTVSDQPAGRAVPPSLLGLRCRGPPAAVRRPSRGGTASRSSTASRPERPATTQNPSGAALIPREARDRHSRRWVVRNRKGSSASRRPHLSNARIPATPPSERTEAPANRLRAVQHRTDLRRLAPGAG